MVQVSNSGIVPENKNELKFQDKHENDSNDIVIIKILSRIMMLNLRTHLNRNSFQH